MAESIAQVWGRKKESVDATTTKVVDTVPLSDFDRLEYIFSLKGSTKKKGFKMNVQRSDSGLSDQVFAKNGDPIDYEIYANVNGSDCEIEFVNNEAYVVEISIARLKL